LQTALLVDIASHQVCTHSIVLKHNQCTMLVAFSPGQVVPQGHLKLLVRVIHLTVHS